MQREDEAPRAAAITGLILAGGQGQRMGGRDKGLVTLAGQPLIAHVLARFAPQVGPLLISANRNLDAYRALGEPYGARLVRDASPDYPGPLAGILAGLNEATTPWLAVVPCDSPFLPTDLVARLSAALTATGDVAVVRTAGEVQPVFALLARTLVTSLAAFLAAGDRKIMRWYALHDCREADFGNDATAFLNINTEAEQHLAVARVASD